MQSGRIVNRLSQKSTLDKIIDDIIREGYEFRNPPIISKGVRLKKIRQSNGIIERHYDTKKLCSTKSMLTNSEKLAILENICSENYKNIFNKLVKSKEVYEFSDHVLYDDMFICSIKLTGLNIRSRSVTLFITYDKNKSEDIVKFGRSRGRYNRYIYDVQDKENLIKDIINLILYDQFRDIYNDSKEYI